MSADVVIVGAGIGGVVLALSLAKRGWRTAILEREPAPVPMVRPEVLWGATPAELEKLGVGEVVRRTASVQIGAVEVRTRDAHLARLARHDFASAGVEGFSTDPTRTRQLIAEAALATGKVEIVRGAEVREVVREGARVAGVRGVQAGAPFERRAKLVVGDDGVRSAVRQALGIEVALDDFPLVFVTAALPWPTELPVDEVRIWVDPKRFRLGMGGLGILPHPDSRAVMLLPIGQQRARTWTEQTADEFWNAIRDITPLADWMRTVLEFPKDFRVTHRPFGHAPRYVGEGAAILGDAGHPMSPAGGQGANAAIWDALALADVAHGALEAGDTSAARLKRYEDLRRPSNAGSVAISVFGARAIRAVGGSALFGAVVPWALRAVDHLPFAKRMMLRRIGGMFVTR